MVAASSAQNATNRAENAIDFSDASTWCAADGLLSNQWLKFQLGGKGLHVIDTVRLRGSASGQNFAGWVLELRPRRLSAALPFVELARGASAVRAGASPTARGGRSVAQWGWFGGSFDGSPLWKRSGKIW